MTVLPKLSLANGQQACTIVSLPPPSYEEHVQNVKRETMEVYDASNPAALVFLCSQQQTMYEEATKEGELQKISIHSEIITMIPRSNIMISLSIYSV